MDMFMKLFNNLRLVIKLMGDSRVPGMLKAIPVAALLYVISPIDLIPDTIPFLTQLDDLGVVLLGIETFIKMAPQEVVAEYRDGIDSPGTYSKAGKKDDVVDGEWSEVKKN